MGRPNLVVQAECLVRRLMVRQGRCTGVSYVRDGAPEEARATGEVILSAGAIGSPQILLLLGLGPPGRWALGIDPVAGIGGVGANLQDHPIVMTSYASRAPLPVNAYDHGEACAALRSGLAGDYPDLHLFPILLPLAPAGHQPPPTGYALVASAVAPGSRGSVRLASPDPGGSGDRSRLLREARDLDRLEAGLAMIRAAASGAAFSAVRQGEVWPGPDVRTRDSLRAYIRRAVGSYCHPAGTCRMGGRRGGR